ncbi:MAG: alcohol dehydrogenase [Candidatus Methanomarinus sp.]|uniref:Alcohol dehydrogenase n=1 Tax=Candidatus Methanomarinus sp. TaxID=3386244 RepID=A0AC61SCY1_9EURY|nr:MAG: alcohol dehydrogenase [ANME-2 cluster archaeon]
MRVAVYYNNKDVRLQEMPVPSIDQDEMLVKVIASGICGSDVLEWSRLPRAPLVLGHEIAGIITKIGSRVKKYQVGDRVSVSHHVPCNTCHYCLSGHHTVCDTLRTTNFDPGGFAEYLRVPAINVDRGVFLLPDNMSFDQGAFIEPLACVYRGQRQAGIRPGQSVLIIGSGITGQLHIKLASALGAGKIIAVDINQYRLELASKSGAEVIDANDDVARRIKELNADTLVDLVIICTGAVPAIDQAFRCVDRGGTILFFASPKPGVTIPLPVFDIWKNEVSIANSYGASPLDISTAIEMIGSKRVIVDDMITHKLGLAQTKKGFELVAEAGESMKVIIEPQR